MIAKQGALPAYRRRSLCAIHATERLDPDASNGSASSRTVARSSKYRYFPL